MRPLRQNGMIAPLAESGLVRQVDSYIDVGAGIAPWTYNAARYTRIEPFDPYADVLEFHGHEVVRKTGKKALMGAQSGTVVLLDVIEHMEKNEGFTVLELAKRAASEQVIVFTPLGFLRQEGDAWGMGGDIWQTHRSGWMPEDFPGWAVNPEFRAGESKGMLAIWG